MGSLHRIAVLCGLTVVLATSVAQAEDWKVAKNEDGIKVSLSEVPGSDYKAYQGVTADEDHHGQTACVAGRRVRCLRLDSRMQDPEAAQARGRSELDLHPVQYPMAGHPA